MKLHTHELHKSNNQLMVINTVKGRVTMTVRKTSRGKSGGKCWKCRISWFLPKKDVYSTTFLQREVCRNVGEDLLAIHAVDPGVAWMFASRIASSKGDEHVQIMRKWKADKEAQGLRFSVIDFDTLTDAPARFVRVASVG